MPIIHILTVAAVKKVVILLVKVLEKMLKLKLQFSTRIFYDLNTSQIAGSDFRT